MGYRISVINSEFFIADQDKYAAFKILKSVYGEQSWFKDCRCLEDVFESFMLSVENDADDNICDVGFVDDANGTEETMLSHIAPFIKDGSYMELSSEGEQWRLCFNDGKMSKKEPKISWD